MPRDQNKCLLRRLCEYKGMLMKGEDVRTITMLETGLYVVGSAQGSLRGATGDELAIARTEGVLRDGEAQAWGCCGRCADCGCESGVEKNQNNDQ